MTQPQGARPAPPVPPEDKKTSTLAVVALVLSLALCIPPLSVAGGVLGIVALVRIGKRPGLGGKGLAIASIPVGATSIVTTFMLVAVGIPIYRAAHAPPETTKDAFRSFAAVAEAAAVVQGRLDLLRLYDDEVAYKEKHGTFVADMGRIGFQPSVDSYYAFFLADSGVVEKRDTATPAPMPGAVIIDVDRADHPALRSLPTLSATGCPVTQEPYDGGAPLVVGVSGTGSASAVVAVAAGNVDDDPTLDCWSIASVDRTGPNGGLVAAGTPLHEQDDRRLP